MIALNVTEVATLRTLAMTERGSCLLFQLGSGLRDLTLWYVGPIVCDTIVSSQQRYHHLRVPGVWYHCRGSGCFQTMIGI
jgi:hypothetical protein